MFQKKGIGTRRLVLAVGISRGFAARDCSAVKSHSTILQRLRGKITLNHYTNTTSYTGYFLRSWKYFQRKRFFLNSLASLSKQEHICFPSNLNIFSTIFPSLFSLQNKKFYYMAESVFAMRLVNLRSVTCYTDQNF